VLVVVIENATKNTSKVILTWLFLDALLGQVLYRFARLGVRLDIRLALLGRASTLATNQGGRGSLAIIWV
jgi:hypothetical protein